MSTLIQDIQTVRSLRKDLRDPKLPLSILNAIESVHNCIKTGTDLNGWKKVDWRGGGSNGTSNSNNGSSNRSGQNTTTHTTHSKGGNNFFGGRGGNSGGGSSSNNNSPFSNSSGSNGSSGNNCGGYNNNSNGNSNSNGMNRSRPHTFNSSRNTHNESPPSIPLSSNNTSKTTPQNGVVNASTSSHNTQANNGNNGFVTPHSKYVSRFKKTTEEVDDTILNTIILGKLNKFSVANYDEIKEFITHIMDSGETDMIKCFMRLVFQKAASEEMFCPLYAKLLSELSIRYPVLLTEMSNLYKHYMSIFEEVETSAEDYNEFVKRNVEKKYRRGYSQFLAELIKYHVIDKDIFFKTLETIIKQVNNKLTDSESTKIIEEYADCMMKIMKAISVNDASNTNYDSDSDSDSDNDEPKKGNMIQEIRQYLKINIIRTIKPLTEKSPSNTGLSTKSRFTFLDIYEAINAF